MPENSDYIVVNSNFKPFSYAEMIQPVLMATQAQQKLEDNYSTLSTKADIWKGLANKETDPVAYSIYSKYSNDLQNAANDLASRGLTPASRLNLLNMNKRYASEIAPIENAYNQRNEQVKAQTEALIKDPTHLFASDASTTSLDKWLANPQYNTLAQNYSGAMLASQVGSMASNLAREARNNPENNVLKRNLDPYTYELIQQHGFSRDDVFNVMQNNPNSSKVLSGLVDSAIDASGINSWDMTPADKKVILDRARKYAVEGLPNAIGADNVQFQENFGSRQALQFGQQVALENLRFKHSKQLADEAAARQAAANGNVPGGTIPLNVAHLLSPNMQGTKGQDKVHNALSTLGLNSTNGRFSNTVNMMTGIIGSYHGLDTKNYNVSVFHRNGNLMTRNQFIDYNSKRYNINARQLGKWYDSTVTPAVNQLTGNHTLKGGYTWTSAGLTRAARRAYKQAPGSSYMLGAFELNFGDKSNDILSNVSNRVVDTEGNLSGIKEIKSFDKNGNLSLGNTARKKDFFDDNGKLTDQPLFYAAPGTNAKDYMMVKINNKMYAIPRSKMGSIANLTPTGNAETYNDLIKNRDKIFKYSLEKGYKPMDVYNKYNAALDESGAGFVRDVGAALGIQYNQKPYDLNSTSESERP